MSAGGGRGGSRPDPGRPDPRRAGQRDRDEHVYARRRAARWRDRARRERESFDPAPPTPDEWTVPEEETDGLRRVSPPTPVGEHLQAYLERRGWAERLQAATAWDHWEQMVGEQLAAHCEPVRLAGRRLVVRADSQVWATQLRYLLPRLRARVEEQLGAGSVAEVHVVVGPLEGRTVPEGEGPERGPDPGQAG